MLFKFSSVCTFLSTMIQDDCNQRTLFVFSEAMSSLKVFISSSVYVTINPGTSSVVASLFCFVELCLAIFWAMFTGFSCFLIVASEEVFYASPRICSSVQNKEEPPAHFKKCFCLFSTLQKVTMVLKTLLNDIVENLFCSCCVRGCLHDTGATFAPERVHSGSLSRLYICLHDTTTNFMLARVIPA